MSDRRVEEYKILSMPNLNDLEETVKAYIRMGFKDPYIGRWEPQGGCFVVTDRIVATRHVYHQAMVRTKKVLL